MTNKTKTDGKTSQEKTYGEMSIEELKTEVLERKSFSERNLKLSDYDYEEVSSNLKNIERWEGYIKEEKEKYERAIKNFKEYIKNAKQKNEKIKDKEKEYGEIKGEYDLVTKWIEERVSKLEVQNDN